MNVIAYCFLLFNWTREKTDLHFAEQSALTWWGIICIIGNKLAAWPWCWPGWRVSRKYVLLEKFQTASFRYNFFKRLVTNTTQTFLTCMKWFVWWNRWWGSPHHYHWLTIIDYSGSCRIQVCMKWFVWW